MSKISDQAVKKLLNFNFWGMHFSALCGFITGAKVCDYFLFSDERFELLREEMEDDYWAKNKEPTEIKPYIIKSNKPGKEKENRKSWIYIMYEKDKIIKKKDDMD